MAAVVLAVVAAACSGDEGTTGAIGRASSTAVPAGEAPTTTGPTSTTSTTATTVRGTPRATTSTTIALGPGQATITGTVNGPAGPVDGATVRIERLVGQQVASTEVRSAGGGYTLASVLGGAYRVRAWKAPDLAQSGTETFFLAADEVKRLDLTLIQYGSGVIATVDPSPPRVDQQATLTVQLGSGRVDDEGRVSTDPRANVPLTLTVGPGLALESPAQATTDANGTASWRLRCTAPGPVPVSLTVATVTTGVNVPPCAAR
ncbi:MAG: carboxypeptidase-like regulatory domain-containing protein [Actinomycetota bacterium]|nr:carboxypeptidase-like regulatory domain-containing protein [Actinomycetota bacterium]